MCGIAGILTHGAVQESERRLGRMIEAQRHRGPDDSGAAVLRLGDRHLLLGHRRLAIIDQTGAGHQPMFHAASGDCLVFNGEIYNHRALRRELAAAGVRFRGDSDTEVLLEALVRFGLEAFSRLSGMYALAWFRARENQLVLARDPLGIKPLYVAHTKDGLVFASETRAILASGFVEPRINLAGVATMLAYGAVQHPLTVHEGIRSFPRACFQVFSPEGVSAPQQFWIWPTPEPARTSAATLGEVQSSLDSAVQEHLVADVPIGVFLSSGLDSTILAGLAGKFAPGLRSFTVGFDDQPDLSEFQTAAETARRFGLQHTAIPLSGMEAERSMEAWMDSMDQPSIDGLNTFVISQAVRAQGIKVALSGLGS
ncbi:MAG: asparagine synthase (glutamine-hydrolyzing), partial [Myxococcales bacterium]|nr:asparagine synthase (glutamine-hydrolyzing) [Myxococcales bacterium]